MLSACEIGSLIILSCRICAPAPARALPRLCHKPPMAGRRWVPRVSCGHTVMCAHRMGSNGGPFGHRAARYPMPPRRRRDRGYAIRTLDRAHLRRACTRPHLREPRSRPLGGRPGPAGLSGRGGAPPLPYGRGGGAAGRPRHIAGAQQRVAAPPPARGGCGAPRGWARGWLGRRSEGGEGARRDGLQGGMETIYN